MELQAGQNLGGYTLTRRIGAGGMGEVWEGEDLSLRRRVAVKVLLPDVMRDEESVARLLREARTAAQISHPNIATVYAFDRQEDRQFIVMEYVEGDPLSDVLRREDLSEDRLCEIGRAVCSALAAAHAKGIIHRDIKPDNIIVTPDGVKVLDFGIAKQIGPPASNAATFATQAGFILGTVFYMSPEQALGRPLDARTDIYSLGVVLYQALAGRLPFNGTTLTEVVTKIVRDELPNPRIYRPNLSAPMELVLRRCLAKERDERFGSADELSSALAAVQDAPLGVTAPLQDISHGVTVRTGAGGGAVATPPTVATPPRRSLLGWALGLGILVVGIAAGVILQRRHEVQSPPADAQPATSAAVPAAASSSATTTIATRTDPPAVSSAAAPAVPPGSNADMLFKKSVLLFSAGKLQEAGLGFVEALELDPAYAPASLKLAEILLVDAQYRAAREEFERALQHRERLSQREIWLAELGLAVTALDREGARAIAAKLDENFPGDPELAAMRKALRARFEATPGPGPRPGLRRRP